MSNDHLTNIPGLEKETPRNIDQDTPETETYEDLNVVKFGEVLINGIKTRQSLVFCPECGDPRIEMEAIAIFRLTNQHVWSLVPITQEELIEVLNRDDNQCTCTECGWTGTFGELGHF